CQYLCEDCMYTAPAHHFAATPSASQPNNSVDSARTKRSYAITARALDYGRIPLAPAVSRTYRVLCDLDFADRSTRRCKGSIWHATATIAQHIGCSKRTIERHLAALERAGLVVRQQRRNAPSLIHLHVLPEREDARLVDNSSSQTTYVSFPYKGTK